MRKDRSDGFRVPDLTEGGPPEERTDGGGPDIGQTSTLRTDPSGGRDRSGDQGGNRERSENLDPSTNLLTPRRMEPSGQTEIRREQDQTPENDDLLRMARKYRKNFRIELIGGILEGDGGTQKPTGLQMLKTGFSNRGYPPDSQFVIGIIETSTINDGEIRQENRLNRHRKICIF